MFNTRGCKTGGWGRGGGYGEIAPLHDKEETPKIQNRKKRTIYN